MVVCAKLERKQSLLWKNVLFWGNKSNPTVTMESIFLTPPQYQGIWINGILDQKQDLSRVLYKIISIFLSAVARTASKQH